MLLEELEDEVDGRQKDLAPPTTSASHSGQVIKLE